jgi:SAM-dependent methyltransferase
VADEAGFSGAGFSDFRRAPNIAGHHQVYERENAAIDPTGVLWRELRAQGDWGGRTLVDLGCGTGFWLPRYAGDAGAAAARVIGVEPDPELREIAEGRVRLLGCVEVVAGSAEHLPFADGSVDVVHARFAYFFPPGCAAGLTEVWRVLRPGGVLVVIDNDWGAGEFAELLRASAWARAQGGAETTGTWWRDRGARRVDVLSGWSCRDPAELETVLRTEFPGELIDSWVREHPGRAELSYGYSLFVSGPGEARPVAGAGTP